MFESSSNNNTEKNEGFSSENLSKQLIEEFQNEQSDDVEKQKKSKIKIVSFLSVLALVCFGTYAWYNDKIAITFNNPENIPLVKAPKTAVRIKPEDPGGMHVANRDKSIYDTISSRKESQLPKVVRLLPKAEEPVAREIIIQEKASLDSFIENNVLETTETEPKIDHKNSEAKNISQDEIKIETKIVEEIVQDKINEIKIAKEAKTEEKVTSNKKEETINATATNNIKIDKVEIDKIVVKNSSKVEEKVKNKVRVVPVPKGTIGKAPSKKVRKGYRIQLGSYHSKADADKNWRRVKKKHSKLLNSLKKNVEKADLGLKGLFYRLQAGFFEKESKARKLCQKLKEARQGCFVVKGNSH